MQYEASMTVYMGRTANQRKVPKWPKTTNQNNPKSNHHIVGINVNIHTKYEVSITIYVARHMCICIPNIKFLCLTLWQGQMLTPTPSRTLMPMMTHDGQFMIV